MNYQYEYIKLKARCSNRERILNDRINKLKAEIYDLTQKINNPYNAPKYDMQFVKLLDIVTKVTNVFSEDIMGRKRDRHIIVGRALFCYIAREHLKRTYTDIGRYINRDHSTVINLCKNYTNYIELKYQPEQSFYSQAMNHIEHDLRTYFEEVERISTHLS